MRVPFLLYITNTARIGVTWNPAAVLTATLHSGAYTPNRTVDQYVSDLTGELPTGGGYTAGGVVLNNPAGGSYNGTTWPFEWVAGGSYEVGNIVRPIVPTGFVYRCGVGGTAGLFSPVWPESIGECVADGECTWTCAGRYCDTLTADDLTPAWGAFTGGPYRHMVISSRAVADPALQPLVGVFSWPNDQQGNGDDLTVVFDPTGVVNVTIS